MTAFTAFLTFLAQAAPAAGAPAGNPAPKNFIEQMVSSGLVMPLALVVMFYFLLIRPQQRQRKEMAARIASLQPGTKVVTTSGIYGLVHSIKERTVAIKVAEGTTIEFDKSAIASVQPKDSGEAKK
ncbi:MAG: preprotein translocase subunit YajC [Verrucomicrobiales bacterium VVV1]|nr:MAG: preprotein translocase subunit YajC [Verrucomicrobiales bacterium VVV1]